MAQLPSGTDNRFLDLLQNREPVALAQLLNIVAAAGLTWFDANVLRLLDDPSTPQIEGDPTLTFAVVYVVGVIIATVYARLRVWSPETVSKVLGAR